MLCSCMCVLLIHNRFRYYENQVAKYKDDEVAAPSPRAVKQEVISPLQPDHTLCRGTRSSSEESDPTMPPSGGEKSKSTMKCLQCGLEFSTRDWGVFRRHMRTHDYPAQGEPFPRCDLCKVPFQSTDEWRLHMSLMHMSHSCVCRSCNIGFATTDALNKHLRSTHAKHSQVDIEYRCLYCSGTFSSESELAIHSKQHARERYDMRMEYRSETGGRQRHTEDKVVSVPAAATPPVRKATPDSTINEEWKPGELL